MKTKLLHAGEQKTFAIIFSTGDAVIAGLQQFAKEHHLAAAQFTAIGALSEVTLGYFDWRKKEYKRIPVKEQVEVVSLLGDVSLEGEEPKVHAHIVVTKADGTAHGGHLMEGYVRPTLEVILTESPAHLRRAADKESGLSLIDIKAE